MISMLVLASAALSGQAGADDPAWFEAKIRPALVEHCLKCHGPTKANSGLRYGISRTV